jgi:hypothetical protein
MVKEQIGSANEMYLPARKLEAPGPLESTRNPSGSAEIYMASVPSAAIEPEPPIAGNQYVDEEEQV